MQTAVQWIAEKFKQYKKDGEKMTWQQVIDTVELALSMEKEQIEKAYVEAKPEYYKIAKEEAEQYYNETYKP